MASVIHRFDPPERCGHVGVSRDEVSRFFANHVDGACDEEPWNPREDRGVDHAQPGHSVHLQISREHAAIVTVANTARARRMMAPRVIAHELLETVVDH